MTMADEPEKPLTAVEAVYQVIACDMRGEPRWQLSAKARGDLSGAAKDMEKKEREL